MPEVSYDNRSFSIDGRRAWLVSGSIHYARTPQALWRKRIRAAKQAGLNCIETRVFWSAHESEPGVFDFAGDLDLRGFVQAVADEGLYCILRVGPYVGGDWDFGGLPGYLHGVSGKKGERPRLRENEPLYMEAVGRYLRAVMAQVGDLQVTSTTNKADASASKPGTTPGDAANGYRGEGGGPIVLMQVEEKWSSHSPAQGAAYLERLVSMMRQQGCGVPIVNNNNLWQPAEGTIDTWNGSDGLPAIMRQLALVQPEAPPMVMSFKQGSCRAWGDEPATTPIAEQLAYRIAGLIGVGAQFNLDPFHGGTNFGFSGGRVGEANDQYVTTSNSQDAPLGEAGERTAAYYSAKRLCTFASHFGHVLAGSSSSTASTIALNETDHSTALLSVSGSQGELVMLLKSEKDRSKQTPLMLPNGLTLNVPHAGQRAAWVLLNTHLDGIATLDYTSLSPWAFVGRSLLIVFGPAGAQGVIAIDGEHHSITVPTGKTPTVITGDPVHIAVLNQEQIDAAYLAPAGLVIGCDGLGDDDQPQPLPGWGTQFTIKPDGQVSRKRINQPAQPITPKMGKWQALSLKPLAQANEESYSPIDGPAALGALGQSFGYGWYRFNLKKPVAGKVLMHAGGDRLHIYNNGKLAALLGKGAGASDQPTSLKLNGDVAILADNLGRYSDGQELGKDAEGLVDHLYLVKSLKPDKPQTIKQPAGDPFAVTALAYHQRTGVRPMSEALAWTIKPESRRPIILEFDGLDQPCVISVNDEPVRYYAAEFSGHQLRLLLDPADDGPMTGGKNTIKLELLEPLAEGTAIDKHIRFYQTTGKATPSDGWGFTPWSIPSIEDANWRAVPKSLPSQPSWLGCTFNVDSTDAPLWLEPHGMSKGQIILNGHNLGRYWQQTREGKQVGPQERYVLPEAWLNVGEPNELMLFDEHGRTPEKCKLSRLAK